MQFEELAEYWWHRAQYWERLADEDVPNSDSHTACWMQAQDARQKADFLMHREAKSRLREENRKQQVELIKQVADLRELRSVPKDELSHDARRLLSELNRQDMLLMSLENGFGEALKQRMDSIKSEIEKRPVDD